ncbi:hypothetical protein [Nocardia pseudobrasiliensis]|uniref:hypothetical protein n=1 Tax=Nocardia pseudobrasiliensis TaxID=45979 RepID=UPI00083571B3|nr:hypothetical protein [Nocardia pseudobrasiliensis]
MALPISTSALIPIAAALGAATLVVLTAIAPQRKYLRPDDTEQPETSARPPKSATAPEPVRPHGRPVRRTSTRIPRRGRTRPPHREQDRP